MRTTIGVVWILACFYQAMGEKVVGYIGQSVVLKTGVDPSFNLSRVQWSIYINTTIIVVWDSGELTDNFWKYKGRLALNWSTGDLEIKNLKASDSMKYSVSLVNEKFKQKDKTIELVVQEHLSNPNVTVILSSLVKDYCIIALRCSSSEDDLTFSWTPPKGFNSPFWSSNVTRNSSELWTSIKPYTNLSFSCEVSKGIRKVSSQKFVQCPEEKPCLRCHYGIICALLFFSIFLLLLLFTDGKK